MDIPSPPSLTQSPTPSPTQYCSSDRSSVDYPSPVLLEQRYKITSSFGEGQCMAQTLEQDSSLASIDPITPAEWHSPQAVMAPMSSSPGSGLSPEYEAFAHYNTAMPTSYAPRNVYQSHSQSQSLSQASHTPQHQHRQLLQSQSQQQQQTKAQPHHLRHQSRHHAHPGAQQHLHLYLHPHAHPQSHPNLRQHQEQHQQQYQPQLQHEPLQHPHQQLHHAQHPHPHPHHPHHQNHQQEFPHQLTQEEGLHTNALHVQSPVDSDDRSSMHSTPARNTFGLSQQEFSARSAPSALDVSGHYPSPRSAQGSYGSEASPYPPTSAGYFTDSQHTTWQKTEFGAQADSYYAASMSTGASSVAAAAAGFGQVPQRALRLAARHQRRPPRRLTTKEEANYQCEVKGCGKLFSRSYNFKAHMETHDEKREYPFPCIIDDCNRKFVRKTDLQRHNQSVHMKERNFGCDYCSRLFARKDTLRRHMDDGCSKRFDLGTLELRVDNAYDNDMVSAPRRLSSSSGGFGSLLGPHAVLPPLAIPSVGINAMLGPMAVSSTDHWVR